MTMQTSDSIAKAMTLLKILGADEVRVIDPAQVVTAPWLKFKCQFQCSHYGTRPSCPPQTPDHKEMRSILDCYQTGIFFLRKTKGDTGEMAHKAVGQLFLSGCYKAAALGNGFCDSTFPTMEACGIDVVQTAKNCGFEVLAPSSGEEFTNFFGLILVE